MFFSPWVIMVPGVALFVLVLGINLLGDGLRDLLGAGPQSGGDAVRHARRRFRSPSRKVEGDSFDNAVSRRQSARHFGTSRAVRGVSLTVDRGETHCLVGESGCGKSVTALAVMGLLRAAPSARADVLRFHGNDLHAALRTRHGAAARRPMAMIFQEPMTSLNPAYTIGSQMAEVLRPPSRRRRAPRHSTAPPNCSAASASPRRACGWPVSRTSSPAACASA